MSLRKRLKSLGKDLVPPLVARAFRRKRKQAPAVPDPQAAAMDAFYGSLLPTRGLCFDVGANVGNRIVSFRRLGHRVVAIEPQPRCLPTLQASFGLDPGVTLVGKAVGSAPGTASMMVSDCHVLSTFSQSFIDEMTKSGRFPGVKWDKTLTVEMTTLDDLLAQYGQPDFIKVDVEGFELEVIRGLSRPIALISLEWAPELTEALIHCVAHLSRLGPISCNLSWGESMRLARRQWMSEEALVSLLNQFREETYLFADLYIRSEAGSPNPSRSRP